MILRDQVLFIHMDSVRYPLIPMVILPGYMSLMRTAMQWTVHWTTFKNASISSQKSSGTSSAAKCPPCKCSQPRKLSSSR